MGTLLTVEGGMTKHLKPANGRDYKGAELRKLLDCDLIEVVRIDNQFIMIIDEEGKFSKEANFVATVYARAHNAIYDWDYIAGDAIIILDSELR